MTKMNTTDLKHKMTETAEKATDMAASALDTAAEAGRTVTHKIAAEAADTFDAVREAATDRAGAVRDTLADAADRFADRLETEGDRAAGLSARVLDGLANGVTTVSDSLRGRSLGDLLADAQGYARRNPGTFALGAAVAGFAIARMIGSSAARASADAHAGQAHQKAPRG